MKNPFFHFKSVPIKKKELPLNRIVKEKQEIMQSLIDSYIKLVEQEARDLVWLVEQSRVVRAYEYALKSIENLNYGQDDIEEFCAEMDSSQKIPYIISGPSGIFISALINRCSDDKIVLRVEDFQRTFHFLGYRLPEGKSLILQGDVGDFIGAGLSGGYLFVEGCAGNWLGAGMINGKIFVKEHVGQKTGEWMRGGEIHVDGQIQSIGRHRFGGRIFRHGKLVIPQDIKRDLWGR